MKTSVSSGGSGGPSNSATNYTQIQSSFPAWNATEGRSHSVCPISGTVKNLFAMGSTTLGAGSFALTVMKNGSAQTLTCTINNGSVSGSDVSNSFPVAAGDTLSLRSVPSSTPTLQSAFFFTVMIEGTNAGESVVMGQTGSSNLSSVSTQYWQPQGNGTVSGTESSVRSTIPTSGTFSNLYAEDSVSPGSGTSFSYTVMKNGSAQALSATVSNTSTTGNDTSNSVSFTTGDTISVRVVPTTSPTAGAGRWGMMFVPSADGESVYLAGAYTAPANSGTSYTSVNGGTGYNASEATRANPTQAGVLKSMYVTMSGSVGVGSNSRTWTARVNSADTAVTASMVSGSGATASDLTNTAPVSFSDLISQKEVDVTAPSSQVQSFGYVLYVAPPPGTSVQQSVLLTGVGS